MQANAVLFSEEKCNAANWVCVSVYVVTKVKSVHSLNRHYITNQRPRLYVTSTHKDQCILNANLVLALVHRFIFDRKGGKFGAVLLPLDPTVISS